MYAVIFASTLSEDSEDYDAAAEEMALLSRAQPGFVDMESVRAPGGRGITVCWWDSLEAIDSWRNDERHSAIQREGIDRWYDEYRVVVAEVLRDDSHQRPD